MEKRYKAYIDTIHFSIELEGGELCTFITHFGQFGNIEIYDQKTDELVLNTVGIFIDKFYLDIDNRERSNLKTRSFHHLFLDYNYQRKLKFPIGGLRMIYKSINKMNQEIG